MPATPYFEGLIFGYSVFGQSYVISNWWLALYSDTTATTEITSASYMRELVTWSATFTNSNDIVFSTYPGSGNTVRAVGLCDTSTSGNLLLFKAITSLSLGTGSIVNVPPGTLILDILNS